MGLETDGQTEDKYLHGFSQEDRALNHITRAMISNVSAKYVCTKGREKIVVCFWPKKKKGFRRLKGKG